DAGAADTGLHRAIVRMARSDDVRGDCRRRSVLRICFCFRAVGTGATDRGERSKLPHSVLLAVIVAGTIWGAMNLACILFFSYAPLLLVAQGSSPTAAASLVSLAIWFTILAIPTGGYLVHRLGRPTAAIVTCALIAAIALALFAAGVHPTISCLLFGVAVG